MILELRVNELKKGLDLIDLGCKDALDSQAYRTLFTVKGNKLRIAATSTLVMGAQIDIDIVGGDYEDGGEIYFSPADLRVFLNSFTVKDEDVVILELEDTSLQATINYKNEVRDGVFEDAVGSLRCILERNIPATVKFDLPVDCETYKDFNIEDFARSVSGVSSLVVVDAGATDVASRVQFSNGEMVVSSRICIGASDIITDNFLEDGALHSVVVNLLIALASQDLDFQVSVNETNVLIKSGSLVYKVSLMDTNLQQYAMVSKELETPYNEIQVFKPALLQFINRAKALGDKTTKVSLEIDGSELRLEAGVVKGKVPITNLDNLSIKYLFNVIALDTILLDKNGSDNYIIRYHEASSRGTRTVTTSDTGDKWKSIINIRASKA